MNSAQRVSLQHSLLTTCCLLTALLFVPVVAANPLVVTSPDGLLRLELDSYEGVPRYRVLKRTTEVIAPSRLGLEFRDLHNMTDNLSVSEIGRHSADKHWQQPWGERRAMREHYNELLVALTQTAAPKQRLHLRIRMFDDGIGFRYEMPVQGDTTEVNVTAEITEFALTESGSTEALYILGEQWNRYEHIYRRGPTAEVYSAATPISFKRADGIHLSIHEAALVDWAGFTLVQRHNPPTLRTKLTPWHDGIAVKTSLPFKSSWRTIQVADSAVGLLNSDLILNLNEPNKVGDVSWVHPGKYTGVWWGMHRGDLTWGSGARHGATNERVKARIDFAAHYGFDGVLVEGWNIGWDGNWVENGALFDFTKSYPDFDMAMLSDYAASKGVKLVGHHETSGNIANYEAQLGDALDLYAKHGYEQIKTGYVAWARELVGVDDQGKLRHQWHDGQFAANHYLKVITEAAKRKISINSHEPIRDTGLRRTYPNWIAREGARGQEFNSPGAGGAGGDGVNPEDHNVNLVYTRMLSGPMDFTPGIFDLHYEALDTPSVVKSTLVHQLALYVALYSPIQMVPDYRKHYERYPDAFQFIVDVPTDWEQSIALQGEMGEHVVWARQARDSDDWYLGAISGRHAREVEVPLDFLNSGKAYTAEIYRDGDTTDWDYTPYDYRVERRDVDAKTILKARLGKGGGLAVRIVPK